MNKLQGLCHIHFPESFSGSGFYELQRFEAQTISKGDGSFQTSIEGHDVVLHRYRLRNAINGCQTLCVVVVGKSVRSRPFEYGSYHSEGEV